MGKTADLTLVQKTTIDTVHKEGKTQKVIAKEAGCSQSSVSKHINREVTGEKRCGRKLYDQHLYIVFASFFLCWTGLELSTSALRHIFFKHYPLYRASDAECTGEDAAPPNERYQLFQERYDVLSQEASKRLLWWFQPRLILSGHTHSGCEVLHESRIPEISVPSFSWRNRNNPSFILGSFSQSEFALSKCFLPEESSIIAVYCGSAMAIALITLGHISLFRGALHLTSSLLGKHKGL